MHVFVIGVICVSVYMVAGVISVAISLIYPRVTNTIRWKTSHILFGWWMFIPANAMYAWWRMVGRPFCILVFNLPELVATRRNA